MKQQFGVIGLGVMGQNLALNLERNHVPVAVYNRSFEKTRAFMETRARGKEVFGPETLMELVAALERPRRVLLMVKAGEAVDAVIAELKPLLEPGDILIDGGNSHFQDTARREKDLVAAGLGFFGMGVSGGEEGALRGPSLMPGGGDAKTYRLLEPVLTRIAARSDSGPCVTHVGRSGAGHFVKMVHNGIEYGDMQLIAEAYDLMRNALGMPPGEIASTFADWNTGELRSYLVEITARIVDFPDDRGTGQPLVDMILDRAGQKGTGRWTTEAALSLSVPVPTLTAAVDARILSSMKAERGVVAGVHGGDFRLEGLDRQEVLGWIRSALLAAKICAYAQGFDLMRHADAAYGYSLDLAEIARIWKAGCIIRAALLDRIRQAYAGEPDLVNLVVSEAFRTEIRECMAGVRQTLDLGLGLGFALPAMAASQTYFDGLRRARGPANLIQAQRDYFGAHTYERVDREGVFHTNW